MALYPSAYGGLWPDRDDAMDLLAQKSQKGLVTDTEVQRLRHWMKEGWVAIPGAIDEREIDAYTREVEQVLRTQNDDLKITIGALNEQVTVDPKWVKPENSVRLLDHYVYSERARGLLMSEPVARFLRLVFEEVPLLFQSLGFEYGSQQGVHQDTAYVVVDAPMTLIGGWIALEDVVEGSGELIYYSGSHRLPEYHFGGSHKHFDWSADTKEDHDRWCLHLHEDAKKMNLPLVTFRPRKGTVLFWHADLAHGGAEITRAGQTRRSLVGHYCPSSAKPNFWKLQPDHRFMLPYREFLYASQYYRVDGPASLQSRL